MESDNQPQRGRRMYSAEFKAEAVQACRQPGVSIRSVALARGLSPSLVRRWVVGGKGAGPKRGLSAQQGSPGSPGSPASSFVAVRVQDRQPAAAGAIHLEIRRGGTVLTLDWPVQEAASCGAWIKEWLR
jgi:transposase